MISDRDAGKFVLDKFREAGALFVEALARVRTDGTAEEHLVLRKHIAGIMGNMQVSVMEPIIQQHPDLLPEEWKPPGVRTGEGSV